MPLRTISFLALLCSFAGGARAQTAPALPVFPAQVREVAHGFGFVEGPVWNPRGFFLFSDIPGNTLWKATLAGKTEVVRHPTGHSNGNAYDAGSRLVSCEVDRVSRKAPDDTFQTLTESYEGHALNAPNDLAIFSDGSIYFSDPTYGTSGRADPLDFRGLFRLHPDGKLELLDRDWQQPNGLCFAPDFSRLYVDDSQAGTLWVYDVAPDGALSHKTPLDTVPKPGDPDGMKCDLSGRLFVAAPGGVRVYGTDGKLVGLIAVPQDPANLCFGGTDGKTLFITARTAVYAAEIEPIGAGQGSPH